ncbi:MAG: hypothetical protein DK306_001376 [Chloroflexi bacterium]|nr:MAG: hypothetical protein DK306_001376 [Chloroflexota bacterium]
MHPQRAGCDGSAAAAAFQKLPSAAESIPLNSTDDDT